MEELNALLQPFNAPVTSERGTIGYQWDTTSDRGMIKTMQIENASITSAKIQSYSFNQGTGGTLTLGGTANGNGVMNVFGSTGATAVTIDNTGILVNDGQIIVKNSGGTNVINANGLVSVSNFDTYATVITNVTVSSTTNTTLAGGSITFTTLSNNVKIFYTLLYRSYYDNFITTNADAWVGINIDGIDQEAQYAAGYYNPNLTSSGSVQSGGWSINRVTNVPTAGTHTINITGRVDAAGTLTVWRAALALVLLGK